jgi:hypothetical protein
MRHVLFLFFTVLMLCSETCGKEFGITLGKEVNGFHIPQKFLGKTIVVSEPENEHTIYAIEDLIALTGTGSVYKKLVGI